MSDTSAVLKLWSQDGCLQCAAEELLAVPIDVLEHMILEHLSAMPERAIAGHIKSISQKSPQMADSISAALGGAMGMTVLTDEVMERMARAGVRQSRITCRTMLLEPHECGK